MSAVQLEEIRVSGPSTIEARWRLGGYLRFPWHPRVEAFEGRTVYHLNERGLIQLQVGAAGPPAVSGGFWGGLRKREECASVQGRAGRRASGVMRTCVAACSSLTGPDLEHHGRHRAHRELHAHGGRQDRHQGQPARVRPTRRQRHAERRHRPAILVEERMSVDSLRDVSLHVGRLLS